MKKIRCDWLLFVAPLLLGAQAASAVSPERDIVAVVSALPMADSESVPGLLTGQQIMASLRNALELVRGGVPQAASPGLGSLVVQLRELSSGGDLAPSLPSSYWRGGGLWLPVRAQLLRVRLDAPDLLPRPRPGSAGGQVGNLPAKAQRIDWLPVQRTAQLVEQAGRSLRIGMPGAERAQRLLEAALHLPRSRLALQDRPLILAYYSVESALAAAPRWDDAIRGRLRRAAEALDKEAGAADLARRLQAQADRLTPDMRGIQGLALALRRQIAHAAGPSPPGDHP